MVFSLAGGYVTDRAGPLRSFLGAVLLVAVSIGSLVYLRSSGSIVIALIVFGVGRSVASTGLTALVNNEAPPEHR